MSLLKSPCHPGEILKHEFLVPFGLSEGALAKLLDVPRTRIERITKEVTGVSPDTAIRLAKFFKTTPEFWVNMQTNFDMSVAVNAVDVSHIEPFEMPEAKVA
ncbi:MAG: HigA family addiction module antidote protein [Rhodobacteraceae bacterium]|nr:HigA family addiction module antidote protein [Paracoccaceae bacterium]